MRVEDAIIDLKRAYAAYNVKHTFEKGMLVDWKRGLRNRGPEGPFVVVEAHGKDSIWPEYLIVGFIDEYGRYDVMSLDSHRLEPLPD